MTVFSTGFSVEALTLAHEDLAGNQQLYNEWMTAYPCQDPIERGFIEQAFTALIEKRRSGRVRATLRADRVRTAVLFLERRQEDDIARCLSLFNTNCDAALRELTRSAAGCRNAILFWEGLEKKLADDGTWYGMDMYRSIQMQGQSADLDELYLSEVAYMTWLDCLVLKPNPKQEDIDKILDPMAIPKALEDRDVKLWPGNPAESRARLNAIVDRELTRLRALEATLRVEYEEPARAEAKDRALAELAREELPLLRAERMHEQSYERAVAGYRKVRKPSAVAPVPAGAARRELDATTPVVQPARDRFVVGRRSGGPGGGIHPRPPPSPTRWGGSH